jgi:hypothetical protein
VPLEGAVPSELRRRQILGRRTRTDRHPHPRQGLAVVTTSADQTPPNSAQRPGPPGTFAGIREVVLSALDDRPVLWTLSAVAVATFGFDLFNFTLTIDSEVADPLGPIPAWIEQGRWGMYVLNWLINPYKAVPVVPTLLAVAFHAAALLLMTGILKNGTRPADRALAGAVGLSYPGICYIYAFKTMNYGVGIGLCLCALSVLAFERRTRAGTAIAIAAGAFAIAIYQSLLLALVVCYGLWLIGRLWCADEREHGAFALREVATASLVIAGSLAVYFATNRFALALLGVTSTGYVEAYLDVGYLARNLREVSSRTVANALGVFGGSPDIYVTRSPWLVAMTASAVVLVPLGIARRRAPRARRFVAGAAFPAVLAAPFALHLVGYGQVPMRSMVALPFVFWGLAFFGLLCVPANVRWVGRLIVVMTVLHFALTANRLLGSAHLALEADRVFAAGLIDRMQAVLADSPDVKYLDLVGARESVSSHLASERETLGASFFGWDEGNPSRLLGFLGTLGYGPNLDVVVPAERLPQLVPIGESMPSWPSDGSIRVHEDTLIIKLGPYTRQQKMRVCRIQRLPEFCGGY